MSRRHLPVPELFAAACGGDRAAPARLLSLIERGGDEARDIGRLSHPLGGNAYTVGLTGAPGAGKSTLTSAIIGHLRAQDLEVAVLAIDPSSPFTGGAILGDRVRMQDHATDPGCSSARWPPAATSAACRWPRPRRSACSTPSAGEWILVETVGVGQVEVEIAGKADTTVVVVNPGWGDSVQANKAGLMEIADVFVINKADRKGVDETRRDLEQMLDLGDLATRRGGRRSCRVVATDGEGVDDAVGHRAAAPRVHRSGRASWPAGARFRLREELREIVARRLEQRAREVTTGERWDAAAGAGARPHARPVGRRRRDAAPRVDGLTACCTTMLRPWLISSGSSGATTASPSSRWTTRR